MLEKAKIVVEGSGKTIPAMYNPSELASNRSVVVKGEGANVQFLRAKRDDLTVALFFDTYEKGSDVRDYTRQIEALLKPVVGKDQRREPPICLFNWANVWFRGVVVRLEQSFIMFLASGIPVRARLNVTFKSVLTQKEELESLGVSSSRKLWVVKSGDRLDLVAWNALGDAGLWRLVAEANDVDDPLSFPTSSQIGTTLIIPDLHS